MAFDGVVLKRPLRPVLGPATGAARGVGGALVGLGTFLLFSLSVLASVPATLRRYRPEIGRLVADMTLGPNVLVTLSGGLGILLAESLFVGVAVGLEGFQGLDVIGLAPLSGFVAAFANTREVAPLIAAVAIASQIGCRFTASLGAMRISEEIDALEVMGVPSLQFLVTTRLLATFTAVVPLYAVGLFGSYIATQTTLTFFFGQSIGTYQHYFQSFLQLGDIGLSTLKVLVFTLVITLVHCYFGFTARGGPVGVGRATAQAIRASTVVIATSDVVMTMLFWGVTGARITG